MKLAYKPDFEEARERWRAFWQREIIDRPCVAVSTPKEGHILPPGPQYLDGWNGDFKEAVARWDEWASHIFFGGEVVPYIMPSFGPDQFGSFLGAQLERSKDSGNTTWAIPFVESWDLVFPLVLDTNLDGWWQRMLQFMRIAGEAGEGKFLVGMLDLHSNMDCLAAIRGPQNLCLDLIDCPDKVHRAMQNVRQFYPSIYKALYEAGNMAGRGTIGWCSFYSEERFAMTQCDFAFMVSPRMFNEFIRPALEEESNFLDHSIYHYDGPGALVHLESVLSIEKLDGIQWVPGAGNPPLVEWLDLLRRIQKAGKCLHIYVSPEEAKFLHKELRPEGLFYDTWAASEKEASELLEWFKRNT